MCLAASEVLGSVPILQIMVVRDDVKWLREALEVVLPVFEGTNDCQHFLVIDLIVLLSISYGLRLKGNWMP